MYIKDAERLATMKGKVLAALKSGDVRLANDILRCEEATTFTCGGHMSLNERIITETVDLIRSGLIDEAIFRISKL